MDFATVWILLSRRGCQSIHDFWHAFLGVLRTEVRLNGKELSGDPVAVCLKIVTGCRASGDYSPLLMTPMAEPYDRRGDWRQVTRDGFNDVNTFGLGVQIRPPEWHEDFVLREGQPTLRLARMGRASSVWHSPRHHDVISNFSTIAQIVLGFSSPEADSFITTICCRLYYIAKKKVSEMLSLGRARRAEIEAILKHRYNCPPDEPPDMSITDWHRLASLLGLTQADPARPETTPATTFLRMHSGTINAGWHGGLIGVTCRTCARSFVYRAAFYKSASEI